MNQQSLRRWHRCIGIAIAPFLLLQGVSGLILTYGVYTRVASMLTGQADEQARTAWNMLVAKTHFGPGLGGWIYHSLVGLGLIWMIASGIWIWFAVRKKKAEMGKEN